MENEKKKVFEDLVKKLESYGAEEWKVTQGYENIGTRYSANVNDITVELTAVYPQTGNGDRDYSMRILEGEAEILNFSDTGGIKGLYEAVEMKIKGHKEQLNKTAEEKKKSIEQEKEQAILSKLGKSIEMTEDPLQEADDLYNQVNAQIGKVRGLYKANDRGSTYYVDSPYTHSNASMAVLCKLLGKEGEAKETLEKLRRRERENGLYLRYNSRFGTVSTLESASIGILFKALGEDEEAERIYEKINSFVGKKGKLYNSGKSEDRDYVHDRTYTGINASMGILAALLGKRTEAEEIWNELQPYAGEEGLYLHHLDAYGSDYNTGENAQLAALAHLLGKEAKAEEIAKKIRKRPGKEKGLYNEGLHGFSDRCPRGKRNRLKTTNANAWMGIYYSLKAGKKINGE